MSVYLDRINWTPAQNRAAAAVLGYEVDMLLYIIRSFNDEPWNAEAARIARNMAKDAAHYALAALKQEESCTE